MSSARGEWIAKLAAWREKTNGLPPLFARIVLAIVFARSGWLKFQDLASTVDYFRQLHIPAPALQAPFVASVEMVGGLLILVGLLTPLASFLVGCTMVVAIATARWSDVDSLASFANLQEVHFLALLLWLVWAGAGKLSLDHLIWGRKRPAAQGAPLASGISPT